MNSVKNELFISSRLTLLSIIEKRYERSEAITIYCVINFFTFIIVLIVDSIIRGNIHRNIVSKVEQLSDQATKFYSSNTDTRLNTMIQLSLKDLKKYIDGKYDILDVEKKIQQISDILKPKQSENNSDHAVSNEKEVIDIKPLGSENNSDQAVPDKKEVMNIDELLGSDSESDDDEYCL